MTDKHFQEHFHAVLMDMCRTELPQFLCLIYNYSIQEKNILGLYLPQFSTLPAWCSGEEGILSSVVVVYSTLFS